MYNNSGNENKVNGMKYISKGALHLHTTYSDGTGTIPQIAADAKKAGLDWIIITDHNSLEGLHKNQEGWYDSVAVIIGEEITPDPGDHYLAIGIKKEIPGSLSPQESIDAVKEQGGVGFIAHPDESLTRKNDYRPLRWSDWSVKHFDGIEIWNYTSDWVDNYNKKLNLYNLLVKNRILKGPTPGVLKWWDEVNNENSHIVSAVGGLDTHAFCVGILTIFPYYDTFMTVTNYLMHREKLSSDFSTAKKQIFNALKRGNNIIVNRVWNNSQDVYEFSIITKAGEIFPGEKIKTDESSKLVVKLPKKARIRLIKNGDIVIEKETGKLELDNLTPGKYRFEAYLKNRPWIFSNPVICE